MRLIIQRINKGQVEVGGSLVGKIQKGLFVLVGVKKGDTKKMAENLAEKLSKLRIMADSQDKMNLSLKDTNTSLLVVSQFTLYANTKKGNRPSFIEAAEPDEAKEIYEYFIDMLRELNLKLETGEFGSYMKIKTELDGPVTILLEDD